MKMSKTKLNEIMHEIENFPPDWHKAGTMYPKLLWKIIEHCSNLDVTYSMETGSGVSTIVFSHISSNHNVFAVEHGNGSISNVKKSPLFNSKAVKFIEGPTQITLPKFKFTHKLQVALIDGPHGYPFPDMEYYYIYPNLDVNALLIVDDIHIPTIHNMYEFIKADEMFDLLEVFKHTAFFRRTDSKTFPPTIDGWWMQNYNKMNLNNEENSEKIKKNNVGFLERFIECLRRNKKNRKP